MNKTLPLNTLPRILSVLVVSATFTGCGAKDEVNSSELAVETSSKNASESSWSSTMVTDNMDASNSAKGIAVYDLSTGTSQSVASMDSYSGNWHFSYQKNRFFHTNSGISGSGNNGIEVQSCVAYEYPKLFDENGDPVKEELAKLNATNTLAKFEAIDVDACNSFGTDSVKTSKQFGDKWYAYDSVNGSFSVPTAAKGWIIKSSDNQYARIKPKDFSNGFVFSVETWDGNNWQTAVDTPALDFKINAYYDFDTNTHTEASEPQGWDILLKKNQTQMPELIMADGVGVAYYFDNDAKDAFTYSSVDQIDNPANPTVGASLYKWLGNDLNGAMRGPGDLGAIEMHSGLVFSPTYTTYLFKDAKTYYKVQILGYKGADGTKSSGNMVVRYASKTVE